MAPSVHFFTLSPAENRRAEDFPPSVAWNLEFFTHFGLKLYSVVADTTICQNDDTDTGLAGPARYY
jgi:hypothetical protein